MISHALTTSLQVTFFFSLLSLRLLSWLTIIASFFHYLFHDPLPSPSTSAGQDSFTEWGDPKLHFCSIQVLMVLSILGHHNAPLTIILLDMWVLSSTPESHEFQALSSFSPSWSNRPISLLNKNQSPPKVQFPISPT